MNMMKAVRVANRGNLPKEKLARQSLERDPKRVNYMERMAKKTMMTAKMMLFITSMGTRVVQAMANAGCFGGQ
jgi:hypothetical protein